MPSRHATAKGKLNGAARKELNLAASNAVFERTVVGTNEDTVFGRVTKMWGNGHCQVLAHSTGGRVQLHKVRIPKNRLGKKGSTPITMSSVVAIFVGKDFDSSKVRETDQFDITAILDDKQVRGLVKQNLVPGWFMKTAEEIATVGPTVAEEDDAWDWDSSADEAASAEDDAMAIAAQVAISRAHKGKDSGNLGDALTKKQIREIKKATAKAAAGKKVKASSSDESEDEVDTVALPAEVDAEADMKKEEAAFMAVASAATAAAAKKAKDEADWSSFGAWRSNPIAASVAASVAASAAAPASAPASAPARKPKTADAWIDSI